MLYIELDVCGVPLHPASAPRIGVKNILKMFGTISQSASLQK